MALSSMTGFARSNGASGPYTFERELKSVNAKGFDLRLRLPPGWDELEAPAKKLAGELLVRGTVYANLNVKRANAGAAIRINEDVLAAVVKVAGTLASKIDAVDDPARVDAVRTRAAELKLPFLAVSAATGAGVPELLEAMWQRLASARQTAA